MRNLLQKQFIDHFQSVINRGMCSKVPVLTIVNGHSVEKNIPNHNDIVDWSEELRELDNRSVLDPPISKDLYTSVTPPLMPTFNLAAYVNKSETLQQLIKNWGWI